MYSFQCEMEYNYGYVFDFAEGEKSCTKQTPFEKK